MKSFKSAIQKNFNSITGETITYVAIIFIVFLLPVHYEFTPPFMVLLLVGWILENFRNKEGLFKPSFTDNTLLILFIAFFIWQSFTVLYSENTKLAWSNIFGRLSLVIFPIVLANPSLKVKIGINGFLKIFAISTALFLLYRIVIAFSKSLTFVQGDLVFNPNPPDEYWVNYFLEREFAGSLHPTYLAMYVLLSALISFENVTKNSLKSASKIFWFVLGTFLVGSLYLISSRASVLAAIIVIPVFSLIKVFKRNKFKWLWIVFPILLFAAVPLIKTNEKFGNLINNLKNTNPQLRSQDERVLVWKSAIIKIRENFLLGVGIGDVRCELTKEYTARGFDDLALKGLNAHNQFLESFLEGGIVEFILFIGIMGLMVYIAFHQKNLLYGLFVLMMIVFFMFETTLYRLAGVAFFSLFSFLLLLYRTCDE